MNQTIVYSPFIAPYFSACLEGALKYVSLSDQVENITLITGSPKKYLTGIMGMDKVNTIISTNQKEGHFKPTERLKSVKDSLVSKLGLSGEIPTSFNIFFDYLWSDLSLEYLHQKILSGEIKRNRFIRTSHKFNIVARSYQISLILLDYLLELNPDIQINVFIDDSYQWKYEYYRNKLKPGQLKYYFYHQMYGKDKSLVLHSGQEFEYNYNPWMQYDEVFVKSEQLKPVNKDKFFTFGMTWHIPDHPQRKQFIIDCLKPLHDMQQLNYDIRLQSSQIDDSWSKPLVEYTDYMDMIARSRYTLVIPSMDPKVFSLRRWIESIMRGCVPLIHADCNWKDGLNHDPVLINLISRKLLITNACLSKKLEYLCLHPELHSFYIDIIKDSLLFKTLTQKSYYQQFITQIKF